MLLLQATGMDAGMAGNFVQATIFMGICVGWVSTYLWRVANKVGEQCSPYCSGCSHNGHNGSLQPNMAANIQAKAVVAVQYAVTCSAVGVGAVREPTVRQPEWLS
jgi:hypothetical protein